MRIALCGNPNVGKTTLFNRLTRSDEPVGNWHGVTVDVRTKRIGKDDHISDLPGTYSLTARTAEEQITCDSVLGGGYDVIACVTECNNLRRNMYLYTQLVELGKRVVLIVNMTDEARSPIDYALLSERLGVPVVATSSRDKNPKAEILAAAYRAKAKPAARPDYLDNARVQRLARTVDDTAIARGYTKEFVALKLMEGDGRVTQACAFCDNARSECNSDIPARLRYNYIDKILTGVTKPAGVPKATLKIDRIVLGKLALPIFLAVMAAVFAITFEACRPLSNLLIGLTDKLNAPIRASAMDETLKSLLEQGIVSGIGSVLAFLPQVVTLFLLTALLQDSGYMSRVAFVTDGFFKKFGLSGRAAFSLVLGLGCSATAVLSSRGISGDGARIRAAVATPFCPCSARLAVFTAISAYFGLGGLAVAAMYIAGFAAALAVLKIMSLFDRGAGSDDELIMEMPPYRLPQAKRVLSVVWHNVLAFLSRVGIVVFGVSVIMWVLCNFSTRFGFSGGVENSLMRTFAGFIAPIFKPLGFGNWKAVTALVSGIAAKETVISVIASLGGMGEVIGGRSEAVSFMIFTCLYVPCIATLSALGKEGGAKTVAISVLLHTAAAYVASLVYNQSAVCFAADKRLFWIVWACAATAVVIAACVAWAVRRKRSVKPSRGAR